MPGNEGGDAAQRPKRRVTVLFSADPSPTATADAPPCANPPRINPPLAPLEVLHGTLRAYAADEVQHGVMVQMCYRVGATILANTAGRGATDGERSGELSPAIDVNEAYLSLDEDDAYSDREGGGTDDNQGRLRDRKGVATAQRTTTRIGTERPSAPPTTLGDHARRRAALAWTAGAVRCLNVGDATSLRQAVSLAEEASLAHATCHSYALLGWCCLRYADACEDPSLRVKLEEHADVMFASALPLAEVGDAAWLRATELRCWSCAMTGDVAQSARLGEDVLRLQPRNPELSCVVALMRSAQGDLEGCEELLRWCAQTFPSHIVARALLVLTWHRMGDDTNLKHVHGVVLGMVQDARALEDYARGPTHRRRDAPRGVGVGHAGTPDGLPPQPPATLGSSAGLVQQGAAATGIGAGVVGHLDPNWSAVAAVARRVAHAFVLISDVCLQCGGALLDVADAMASAALEWLTAASAEAPGGWSSPVLVAKVLSQRAQVVAERANADHAGYKRQQVSELVDQCFALDTTALRALPTEEPSEALMAARYAARCDPTNETALQRLAQLHCNDGDYGAAVDVLMSAADAAQRKPIYPVRLLLPWLHVL